MAAELHETAAGRLARLDQRYTANRRALVEILDAARHPLSIPDVLAGRRKLPQSSVYRNLAILEHAGVVRRVQSSDEFARYELAEDLTEHHHHLICSSCGKVEDFPAPSALERTLARAISAVGDETGFTADHHRLDLIGRCAACV